MFNLGEFDPASGLVERIGIFDLQLSSTDPGRVKWTLGQNGATAVWTAGAPTGSEIPEIDKWYHLACVHDSSSENNSRMYINGIAVSGAPSGTFVVNTNMNYNAGIGSTLQIAGRDGENGEVKGFNGRLDNIAVWKDDLMPSEIEQLYLLGRSGDYTTNQGSYISSSDLKSYYQFNKATGATVEDTGPLNDDGVFSQI